MLLDQIQLDLASAQKVRDRIKVDTLRYLLGAIFNLQIEKYPPSKGGALTDEDVLNSIGKQIKTHKESVEMFQKAKRADLVEREKAEMAILESYLPKQMTEEEIKAKLIEIRRANYQSDFGTLMKLAMDEMRGQADGTTVAKLAREILNSL